MAKLACENCPWFDRDKESCTGPWEAGELEECWIYEEDD